MLNPVVLATCLQWPDLSVSDRVFADTLRVRGVTVEHAPWNGPFHPFERAGAVVVRSTWDYHMALDDYRTWLGRLDPGRTFNSPDLVRWNLDKTYLLEVAARGATIPRSRVIPADATALASAMRELSLTHAVVKPTVGASGFGVERVTAGAEDDAIRRVLAVKSVGPLLIQEFMPEVVDGELAGVFFDGTFSHGARRRPAAGDFRVNSQFGGQAGAETLPPTTVMAMQDVVALLPARPLYARIDGIVRDGHFVVMEVEVNEPALGLHLVPGAADRFCDALLSSRP